MAARSADRWPVEDIFLIQDTTTLKRVKVAHGEWLGIYRGPKRLNQVTPDFPFGQLLLSSRSPADLSKKVKKLSLEWPLVVRRASCEAELSRPLQPSYDRYRWLRQRAYEAIAEARKRGDQEFLRDLANEARAKGRPTGDKTTAQENRRLLDVLHRLAAGFSLKEIAINMYGEKRYESHVRSLSVSLGRFQARLRDSLNEFCNGRSGTVPELLSDSYVRYIVRDWPGVTFPHDRPAFREAIRRYSAKL